MSEIYPMDEETDHYHAYLLRMWRTQHQGEWHWRASLESPHTGERQLFADLEQLFLFLSERCESQTPHKPDSETNQFTRR